MNDLRKLELLTRVKVFTDESGGACAIEPFSTDVKELVFTGYLTAIKLRSGPLGIYTGENELRLTRRAIELLARYG